MSKPLAFIDVDGVLNRMVYAHAAKERGLITYNVPVFGNVYTLYMDPADKGRLERLAEHFELAWGTTWEHHANEKIAPLLGLPEFPIVAVAGYGEHTKVRGVVRAAEGRPFVWLDDMAFMIPDLEDAYGLDDTPWKFIEIDPGAGLTDADIDTAIAWAEALDTTPSV